MKKTTKWEYRLVDVAPDQTIRLNDYGVQGWELVTVVYVPNNTMVYYFKRPLKP